MVAHHLKGPFKGSNPGSLKVKPTSNLSYLFTYYNNSKLQVYNGLSIFIIENILLSIKGETEVSVESKLRINVTRSVISKNVIGWHNKTPGHTRPAIIPISNHNHKITQRQQAPYRSRLENSNPSTFLVFPPKPFSIIFTKNRRTPRARAAPYAPHARSQPVSLSVYIYHTSRAVNQYRGHDRCMNSLFRMSYWLGLSRASGIVNNKKAPFRATPPPPPRKKSAARERGELLSSARESAKSHAHMLLYVYMWTCGGASPCRCVIRVAAMCALSLPWQLSLIGGAENEAELAGR